MEKGKKSSHAHTKKNHQQPEECLPVRCHRRAPQIPDVATRACVVLKKPFHRNCVGSKQDNGDPDGEAPLQKAETPDHRQSFIRINISMATEAREGEEVIRKQGKMRKKGREEGRREELRNFEPSLIFFFSIHQRCVI